MAIEFENDNRPSLWLFEWKNKPLLEMTANDKKANWVYVKVEIIIYDTSEDSLRS